MRKQNSALALRIFINSKDAVNSISVTTKQNKAQTIIPFKRWVTFNINADEYHNKYLH